MASMKLAQHEKTSALWLKLEAHYTEQLESMRRKNDGALTPDQTIGLRARIAQVKAFLALATEQDNEVVTDEATTTTKTRPPGFGFPMEQL